MAATAEQIQRASDMRNLPAAKRELAIIYGVLSGVVIDARKRFRPENAVRVCSDDWCD